MQQTAAERCRRKSTSVVESDMRRCRNVRWAGRRRTTGRLRALSVRRRRVVIQLAKTSGVCRRRRRRLDLCIVAWPGRGSHNGRSAVMSQVQRTSSHRCNRYWRRCDFGTLHCSTYFRLDARPSSRHGTARRPCGQRWTAVQRLSRSSSISWPDITQDDTTITS